MASITVKQVPAKPLDPYEGVGRITLELDVEEAKALIAINHFTVGGISVGRSAIQRIGHALQAQFGAYSDQKAHINGVLNQVEFTR